MYRCQGCGSGYLDPQPTRETIALAYNHYLSHDEEPALAPTASTFKRLRVAMRNGYLIICYPLY
jgi:hypothetical protein